MKRDISRFIADEVLSIFLKEQSNIKDKVVIYSGRFQPYHRGHQYAYEDLVSKFGKNNVYIATSNKSDNDKSPFTFNEKKEIITKLFGIPSNKVINVKNPYKPEEILNKFDPKKTAVIVAIGEKDVDRLSGKYYVRYDGIANKGYLDKGYVYIVPQLQLKLKGKTISGTEVRKNFSKEMFKHLYPKFDLNIYNMMKKKLSESLIVEGLFVRCMICGELHKQLTNHIPKHNITIQEYKEKYPNSKLVSEEKRNKNSITLKQLILDIQDSKNPPDNKILLLCSGGYGHLKHPFEDMDLTFGDMKVMIKNALQGKLELAQEKTDGQNLMFSWIDGKLRVARNGGHLKNFGKTSLDLSGISNMFAGRGNIQTAFTEATRDLEAAVSKLSQKQKDKIFANGKKFMSVEVIYPANANVIPYGLAMLVFHGTMEYDEAGNVINADKSEATTLAGMIKQINADVQTTFKIRPPNNLKLPKVQNFSSQQTYFISKLNKLQQQFKLKDSDPVMLYHQKWWENFINDEAKKLKYSITNNVLMLLIKRWAYADKSAKINDIKKRIDNESFVSWVNEFDKNSYSSKFKDNIKPFEQIFLELSVQVLKNMNEFLTVNPDASLKQIKADLSSTISKIQSSNDIKDIELLNKQMDRLNSLGGEDILVPSEGITFMYNNKLYKLTGAFAPLNQIMGIGKFR